MAIIDGNARPKVEPPLLDDLPITKIDLKASNTSQEPPETISDDRSSQISERSTESNVDNPLAVLSPSDLNDKVAEFVRPIRGLNEHLDILQRGAQLKRDEEYAVENDFALSNDQKIYLKHEKDFGLWGQSKFLKGSLFSACLAGVIQGWTQSAMNGANVGITTDFNIHNKIGDPLRNTGDLWLFGIINAIPFFTGGMLAPLISDPLQEHWLGRRGAMAVACLLSIAATIGQAFSTNPAQLIGCRMITGLSLAAKASAAPLLTAEIAPDHLRGNLLSTWQLSDAFGIFLGFASNLAVLNVNAEPNIIWRIQTAMVLIPTVALLLVVYFMPESPRYLMKRGKQSKALESFQFLRPSPVSALLAARDYIYAHFQLEKECRYKKAQRITKDKSTDTSDITGFEYRDRTVLEKLGDDTLTTPLYDVSRTNYFKRLSQTFRDPPSRRALVCASTAMIAQQLTGVNTLAFLSATLLNDRGASDRDGAWVGFGLGLCNFLFGLPSFYLLEKIGRATMLLLGLPFMSILILALAFGFEANDDSAVRVPIIAVFGILFMIAYSPTAGPAPFAISAEVFPLVIREVGHSIAVAVNFVGLGFILLIFPFLSDVMGGYTASLSLFAALNIVAFVLCFLFVPETKGRSLEELQFTFDRPTSMHIKYRVRFVARWYTKKYLRPVAVKLHLWDKKKLRDPGPYVQYHRWERPGLGAE